eukprot:1879900-Rhodomonas_salina.1
MSGTSVRCAGTSLQGIALLKRWVLTISSTDQAGATAGPCLVLKWHLLVPCLVLRRSCWYHVGYCFGTVLCTDMGCAGTKCGSELGVLVPGAARPSRVSQAGRLS